MKNFTEAKNSDTKKDHWVTNSKTENPYHIFVSYPQEPAPPSGYPVIYVLDGNAFFQTVAETTRLQSRRCDKTGVPSAIVVGIGYPGAKDFVADRRFYDFTPPANSVHLPNKPNGGKWPNNGGADLFLDFIQEELKPFIQDNYPVNLNQQCLFGHSLGGLFTLYALFNQTITFQNYIASSPSIWWNNQAVLEEEKQVTNLSANSKTINLFLSVGSLEKDYMIKDTEALFNRLNQLPNSTMYTSYHKATGENHLSVVPTVLSRSLRFIFKNYSPY